MTGPMNGFRVVEAGTGLTARMVGMVFADYGASVQRVELPANGDVPDPLRAVFDRGKRSLVCDLTAPQGIDILRQLSASADVLIEDWSNDSRPEGFERESVRARWPTLIICSLGGEHANASHETLAQAAIGLMAEQAGHRDGPIFAGYPVASQATALLGLLGTLAALYQRQTSGQGERVTASLVDGVLAMLAMYWQDAQNPTSVSNARAIDPHTRVLQGAYLCKDGEYLGIHTAAPGAHARLMEVLGLSDEIRPAQMQPEMAQPLSDEEVAVLERDFLPTWQAQTRDEWLRSLLAADVCAIPVHRPTEAFDEPQIRHNGMVVELHDPVFGPVEEVAQPFTFGRYARRSPNPAPRPGEHSREIMAAAGYEDTVIDRLLDSGIIS